MNANVTSIRRYLWLGLALLSASVSPAAAVQFGRCDVQVGTAPIGVASAGVDDSGRPVLLVLQGGSSSRVIRVVIDPTVLPQACDLGISSINLLLGNFQPQAFAVGDVNGDRLLDFVVAGSDGIAGHDVLVYLGTGDGQFSQDPSGVFRQARDGANSIAIADVDRDGVADLVVGSDADSSVTVLYSGTTRSEALSVQGVSAGSLGVGFLNSDGLPDIITGSSSTGRLSALFQSAARTFVTSASPTSVAPRGLTLGDLNDDLISDLLVTRDSAAALDLYLGPLPANLASIGSPSLSLSTGPIGAGPAAVAAGDFTGDGQLDVVVANRDNNTVALFVGNGRGNLEVNSTLAGCRAPAGSAVCDVGDTPTAVIAADANGGTLDLDGDGIGDIVVANANGGRLSLLLSGANSALATVTPTETPITPGPSATPTPTETSTPSTSCCDAHADPGCEPVACSKCVGDEQDTHCRDVEWDDICVGFARSHLCADVCNCPAVTETPTPEPTGTITGTPTITPTPANTASSTPTQDPTNTLANPPPATRTPTNTVTPTGTLPTATRTPTRTFTPTDTPTISPTSTVQSCIAGGSFCINGQSGCNSGGGSDSVMLIIIGLVPALLLLARRRA